MLQRWLSRSLLSVILLSLIIGCGGGDPKNRQPVSGTVKYKGKEIKYGTIRFEPAENQPTAESAEIRDGKYKLAEKEGGLTPGKYRVFINAPDKWELSPNAGPPGNEVPPKETIPAKYNEQTTLDFTVKQVGAKETNVADFDLK